MILSIFSSVCVCFFFLYVYLTFEVSSNLYIFILLGCLFPYYWALKILGVFCVQTFYQIDDVWWFSLSLWIVFELYLLKISTELILLYYSVGEYPFRVDLTCLYFLNVVIYKFISISFSFFSNFFSLFCLSCFQSLYISLLVGIIAFC